jgi:hypothetical protein
VKCFFVTVLLSFLITKNAGADERITVERSTIDMLWKNIDVYQTLSNSLPADWHELFADNQYWAERNRVLLEGTGKVIPEHYVFTPTNFTLLPPKKGYILVARYKPLKEDGVWGRYVVIRNLGESLAFSIQSAWIDEKAFQKLVNESNVKLPEPDPAEVRAAKEGVKNLIAEEERVSQIVRQNAPSVTSEETWSVWRERIKGVFIKPSANGSQKGHIRPAPVAITLLALFGVGFFVWRRFAKGKKQSSPPLH